MNAANTSSVAGDGGRTYRLTRILPLRGDDAPIVVLSDGKAAYVMGHAAPSYQNSTLTAVDLATGRTLWGPIDFPWRAWAFLAPGAIYVSAATFSEEDGESFVARYDTATGKQRWRTAHYVSESRPLLLGNILHVGPFSLDADTGRLLRTTLFADHSLLTEMVTDGRWLYHAQVGQIRRVNPTTMKVGWRYRPHDGTSWTREKTVVVGDRLYAWQNGGHSSDTATVHDTATGRLLRVRETLPRAANATTLVDVIDDGLVAHPQPEIIVRDRTTDRVRWRRHMTREQYCACYEEVNGDPLIVGNTLFVSISGGWKRGEKIMALDVRTGSVLWQQPIPYECRQIGNSAWINGKLLLPSHCGVRVYTRTG